MLIRVPPPHPIRSSEITPEAVYHDRRRLLAGMGAAAALAGIPAQLLGADTRTPGLQALAVARRTEQAGGEKPTPFEDVSTYNNYYEFGTSKDEPAKNAHTLRTRPWTVVVDGECEAPAQVGIEELVSAKTLEERIYRFRCVEAWSMVVPWVGMPLGTFLARFKPTSKAKYVAFETLNDRRQMPLAKYAGFDLPYVEGLRIDEAMHPLTLLSVGMYGRVLPNQNGAPVRLIVPWKYGYKSIKSIVRIRFVASEPPTTWKTLNAREYGFFSNVNPSVSHPRWSQASERRLGQLFRQKTRMWNGYDEVASLYNGMDLTRFH